MKQVWQWIPDTTLDLRYELRPSVDITFWRGGGGGWGGGGVSGSERIKARFHSWSEVIEFLLHKF